MTFDELDLTLKDAPIGIALYDENFNFLWVSDSILDR